MIPRAGEIAWVELDPVRGREQSGRRPALVVTDATYNEASTRVVICPISRTIRNWPWDVLLPMHLRTTGVVMVDQVRSIDRSERLFAIIETAPPEVLVDVRDRLAALLGDCVSGVIPDRNRVHAV